MSGRLRIALLVVGGSIAMGAVGLVAGGGGGGGLLDVCADGMKVRSAVGIGEFDMAPVELAEQILIDSRALNEVAHLPVVNTQTLTAQSHTRDSDLFIVEFNGQVAAVFEIATTESGRTDIGTEVYCLTSGGDLVDETFTARVYGFADAVEPGNSATIVDDEVLVGP